MTRDYKRPGDVFHELGDLANNPPPESPTSRLQREQAARDDARKAALDAAVAARDREREADRISGV